MLTYYDFANNARNVCIAEDGLRPHPYILCQICRSEMYLSAFVCAYLKVSASRTACLCQRIMKSTYGEAGALCLLAPKRVDYLNSLASHTINKQSDRFSTRSFVRKGSPVIEVNLKAKDAM